ncbi:YfhO family protein [Clostridium oryzae]|uniref:Bacterial membrane protein YfhO n=1 Tax=Clostridium oryzae TaxID=1450648 RepID=A0A1V4IJZ0_9CLOT|nr:YfhO family protein [Clostridium oryzae]OPJ60331.1 bacterial membrane protein YfhO [Clostridium oryzae]
MITIKARINEKLRYILIYSALFALMGLIIFSPFIAEHKSFVWISDGTDQHYTSLIYYSRYLRNLIKKIFIEGKFELPMWDFKIGQGSDILTTLSYYCIGDPLTVLSIFFDEAKMEMCYNFLTILRLYLSGLSFSAYCFYIKQSKLSTLTGALVYTFCGYALLALRHPFFLNPLIYLPILFLGIDKILKKEKPFIFVGIVFISAISNFYFLYMLSLQVFIYAVIRYFYIDETSKRLKDFLVAAVKAFMYYMLGIAMAAFVLLPIILVMKETSRFGESRGGLICIYPIQYYSEVFSSLFYIPRINYWSCLGYPATGVFVVLSLFHSKSPNFKQLKIAFIIGVACFTIPAAAYLFNGFAYVSNRWIFGFSFVTALVFAVVQPHLKNHINQSTWASVTVWIVLLLDVNIFIWLIGYKGEYIPAAALIVSSAAVFFAYKYRSCFGYRGFEYIFAALTIISICVNGNLLYNRRYRKVINEFSYKNEYLKNIINSPMKLAAKIKDSDFFRVDTYRWCFTKAGERREVSDNEAMLLNYRGISTYFSLINPNYSRYINKLDVIGILDLNRIYSLDNRTTLNALASVKYFLSSAKQHSAVPYGYEPIKKMHLAEDQITLYKNKYFLPLGYTYTSSIKASDFEKLDLIDKQQVMLEKVILEDDINIGGNDKKLYSSKVIKVPYKEIRNQKIDIKYYRPYHVHNYSFKTVPNSEVYVVIKNVKFTGASKFYLIAETDNTIKFAKFYNKGEAYYFGRKNAVINLGYFKNSISDFMLYVNKAGELSYDEMNIVCVPMNDYADKINVLKDERLENISVSNNTVSGNITIRQNKILYLSIPYSSGWKVKVDGKNALIYKANIMYMAVPLQKGNYNVELTYCTPGLKTGAAISIGASILFIFLFLKK